MQGMAARGTQSASRLKFARVLTQVVGKPGMSRNVTASSPETGQRASGRRRCDEVFDPCTAGLG